MADAIRIVATMSGMPITARAPASVLAPGYVLACGAKVLVRMERGLRKPHVTSKSEKARAMGSSAPQRIIHRSEPGFSVATFDAAEHRNDTARIARQTGR